MKWFERIFGTSAEAEKTMGLTADLVHKTASGELLKVAEEVVAKEVEHNIFARREVDENREHASGFVVSDPDPDPAQAQDTAQAQAQDKAQAQNTALGAGAGAVAVSDSSPAPALALAKDQPPALDQPPDPATALDQPRDQDPTLLESTPSASDPASDPALPDQNLNNPIIESIRILVDSIFTKDDADPLKNYFFSIFIPPEDDIKEKSTASTPSPAPTITPAQETELRETLEKCVSAYTGGDTDLTLSDSSDPQSNPTKTISKLSPISKAQPPVYFGVGIKTTLEDIEGQKFLKITDIFEKSNLDKSNKDKFITHLNCKLGDDTVAQEYSITDIFNKFKDANSATAQEKIDKIFRDISQTSIKFKISTDTSQTDPATQPTDVTVDKIIFEKTNEVYQQKKMTPSTAPKILGAKGKGVEAGVVGVGVPV